MNLPDENVAARRTGASSDVREVDGADVIVDVWLPGMLAEVLRKVAEQKVN